MAGHQVLNLGLPRKFGQHFLVNKAILETLAQAICGDHVAQVIEIGPGRGALTRHLLPRTDELHAIEIDAPMVDFLRREFATETKLHVHQADVLETDLTQWGAAVVAGNLPYYITSPIITKFLEMDERFHAAVFLVQREVAERLMAKPGTRDYGYLTVSTHLVCEVKLVCQVPAGAFSPPPKVESTAVRLERKSAVTANLTDLLTFVSRCFAQKRKTLRNNLRPFYAAAIEKMPEAGLRAEQLPVSEFAMLLERLKLVTQ